MKRSLGSVGTLEEGLCLSLSQRSTWQGPIFNHAGTVLPEPAFQLSQLLSFALRAMSNSCSQVSAQPSRSNSNSPSSDRPPQLPARRLQLLYRIHRVREPGCMGSA